MVVSMKNKDYITDNFLTLKEVSEQAAIELPTLQRMISEGLMPGPAYEIKEQVTIYSFFGECVETVKTAYYPHAYVEKAQQIQAGNPLVSESATYKKEFCQTYKTLLATYSANKFGLQQYFNADGVPDGETLEAFIDSEWQHYLNGTYGLCTKNGDFTEIALKEVMIAKIKHLAESETLTNDLLEELKEAVDLLDTVSADFAPFEKDRSSRAKYIDAVRNKYFKE